MSGYAILAGSMAALTALLTKITFNQMCDLVSSFFASHASKCVLAISVYVSRFNVGSLRFLIYDSFLEMKGQCF